MNDRAMQYRLRPGGPWQALLPGIYLSVTGTPTFEQKPGSHISFCSHTCPAP